MFSGPGDETAEAKQLHEREERLFKMALQTNMDVATKIIGLDKQDKERIQILWGQEFANVQISTYVGLRGSNDYTKKAREFAEEFFGAVSFDQIE